MDLAGPTQSRSAFFSALGLRPDAPTVALLPGSRPNELSRIAPDMAAAMPLIRARVPDAQFVVARAPNLADELLPRSASACDDRRQTAPTTCSRRPTS